ncbi:MAG: DUF6588 family protein [Prolixibacteraceae bacterium]
MKKKVLLFVVLLSLQGAVFAQSDVVEFIQAGKDDASTLVEAYLNPYVLALGDGLNNGWFNSASTHKILGMDLAINVSAVRIPTSQQSFNVNEIGLTRTSLVSGDPNAPTAAGKEEDGPRMKVALDPNDPNNPLKTVQFNLPQGSGYDLVPVPMAQLTLGVLPHSDLSIRYVPERSYNDDEISFDMFGLGLKHNFIRWIPGLKLLPVDASVYVNFSAINAESALDFSADDYDDTFVALSRNDYDHDENQRLMIETRTSSYGLVVSKKMSVLTLFASAGHSSSKSDIDLKGRYPFAKYEGNQSVIYGETDPIALDFESSNMALSAGFRLKLAFFSLYGSINRMEYTSYNAGISLGFRYD